MADPAAYANPNILRETYPLEKHGFSAAYEDAVFETILPNGVRKILAYQTTGKRLAEDVYATEDIPNETKATMDGYAVRVSDSDGPHGRLKICKESYAGKISRGLPHGVAVYVRNGGLLPKGADSIIRVEEAIEKEGEIFFEKPIKAGDYVAERGSEAKAGQIILRRGTRIDFSVIGILGILGRDRVRVYRNTLRRRIERRTSRVLPLMPHYMSFPTVSLGLPKVTVFSTGSEIVPLGEKKNSAEMYEKNSYVLGALLKERDLIPVYGGILPDDTDTISTACLNALTNTDYVLISGGTSVGRLDKINSVFDYLKKRFGFTIKNSSTIPERVQLGYLGRKCIWAMPGRTVRAIQILITEVLPVLSSLSGGNRSCFDPSRLLKARLIDNESWDGHSSSPFVRIIERPGEENIAIPLPFYREFTCLSNMNAMVLSPKNGKGLVTGEEILVYGLF